jgi:uncharacterized protein YbaA (DUF1428 family)
VAGAKTKNSFRDVVGGGQRETSLGQASAGTDRPMNVDGAHMNMTDKYVDGFVIPVPAKNIEAYRQFSAKAGAIWKEHGALEYIECVADDVKPGKVTSFPQAVKLEGDEVVVFSWIVYQSREDRDRVNAAVMSDSRLEMDPQAMPFDGKRMFWGGFKVLLAT